MAHIVQFDLPASHTHAGWTAEECVMQPQCVRSSRLADCADHSKMKSRASDLVDGVDWVGWVVDCVHLVHLIEKEER